MAKDTLTDLVDGNTLTGAIYQQIVDALRNIESTASAAAVKLAAGGMINGKISVTVASNNITLALKTLADADPSATDPVYVNIDGTLRQVAAGLSVTVNAGASSFNSGSSELATKEIDYFALLRYNATDGICIGFARLPYGRIYSDFSTTATNEKYAAWSTIANAAASDACVVIGRFAATLSAGAGYTWTVPTYTAANLVQFPIFATRLLDWAPQISYSGGTTGPTSNTVSGAKYLITHRGFDFEITSALVKGSGNRTTTVFTMPFTFVGTRPVVGLDSITAAGAKYPTAAYIGGANLTFVETMANDGTYWISGGIPFNI